MPCSLHLRLDKGSVLQLVRRCVNAAQVDDLPCMAEVDIACAVFHLLLKLSRVWHVMGSQSFNVQQLQNAIDEDAEIAQCKVLANALLSTTLTSRLYCNGLPAWFC